MNDWLKDIAGPNFVPAALWTGLGLVVLVLLLVIVRIVRSMTFGTFVAGGRNRKTRLAVMDAAPVDSQRRLVLVRRDDVEHLILIGGPTDVVVERDIRLLAAGRRTSGEHAEGPPRPWPVEVPGQPRPDRAAQPPRAAPPAQGVPPARPAAGPAAAAPVRMPPVSAPVQQIAPAPPRTAPPPPADASAGSSSSANGGRPVTPAPPSPPPPAPPRLKPVESVVPPPPSANKVRPRPEMSLEDEMNRLLGELSSKK